MMGLGLGMGLEKGNPGDQGTSYSPEAQLYFDQLIEPMDDYDKLVINDLFIGAPAIMAKADRLYLNFVNDPDNSHVTLVNPLPDRSNSGCSFSPYRGWTGAAASRLAWEYQPYANGVNFTRNAGCIFAYVKDTTTSSYKCVLGASDAGEANGVALWPRVADGNNSFKAAVNSYSYGGPERLYKTAFIAAVKTSTTNVALYVNGVFVQNVTVENGQMCQSPLYELAFNINGSLSNAASGWTTLATGIGGWTTSDMADLYDAIKNCEGSMPLWTGYGDSIMMGYNLTEAESYFNLLCADQSKTARNMAVSGQNVAQFLTQNPQLVHYGSRGTNNLLFGFGINDSTNRTTGQYAADLATAAALILTAGWPPSRVWFITDYYCVGTGGFNVSNYRTNYVPLAEAAADANGFNKISLYGTSAALQDDFHPTAAGQITYFNAVKAAMGL